MADLTLTSGPGYMLADLRRGDREHEAVRFLSQEETLLSPGPAEYQLRRFVEDTIQQLEDNRVDDTALQQEWAAISSADEEVTAFCRKAAALNLDPYDLATDEESAVLSIGEGIDDIFVVAEAAASTSPGEATEVNEWLKSALAEIDSARPMSRLDLPFEPLSTGRRTRPWVLGYQRAGQVREKLGSSPHESLDVESLVAVTAVAQEQIRRFAAARAIGRRTFDNNPGGLLLTRRDEYAAKVERAFAAELLAPAEGLREALEGDVSDESIKEAADRYRVSIRVIEHQLGNQLSRWGGL